MAMSSQLIRFGLIAWLETNNMRKAYGDDKVTNELRNSLAFHGWVWDNPVPAVKDPKSSGALTTTQLAAEMERRQTEWTRLKEILGPNNTLDNQAQLIVFEALYTEPVDATKPDKERKLLTPIFSGNAGFRRARQYRSAMAQRYTNKAEAAEKDIRDMIPIREAFYKNDADRLIDQQLENEMQGVGTKRMENLEKLAVTKVLYDAGCLEIQVRRLYSSSTGQKAFGICQANSNWPALKVYDRFFIDPAAENVDFIPWGPIDVTTLIKLNARFEADRKRKDSLPLTNDQRALEPIKQEEVDNYFREKAKTATTGNAQKIMPKAEMEGKVKNHKLLMGRAILDSVLGNTEANLKPLMDHADSLNGVFELVKGGDGQFADDLIGMAKAYPDVFKDVIHVLQQGKSVKLATTLVTLKSEASPAPEATPPTAPPAVVEPSPAPSAQQSGQKSGKKQTVGAK